MHDVGNHPCLSEDWLLDNLPKGWTYDCHTGDQWGFWIIPPGMNPETMPSKCLFIPLDLLKVDRTKSC